MSGFLTVSFRTVVKKYNYEPHSLMLRRFSSEGEKKNEKLETSENEFRVLNLRQTSQTQQLQRKKYVIKKSLPIMERFQKNDVEWGAVWPGPQSFHPASVPLPLRQGFTEKDAAPPSKYGNAELMKIQNFLHLTPPVIRKQCEALKKFCNAWPKGLEDETKIQEHFPVEYITSDYCHALPTIRNPLARIITIKLKLSNLKFDEHARDKFLRLVGDRYNPENDTLTITTDRCPLRKQNYNYAQYLLTACYHESFVTEPWESSKSKSDMEYYDFNQNKSKISASNIINWGQSEQTVEVDKDFGKSVEDLINNEENDNILQNYKEQSKKLLGIPSSSVSN